MTQTACYIGLGNMGRVCSPPPYLPSTVPLLTCHFQGMAKNIALKGSLAAPLAVYNRTTARADALVSALPEGRAVTASSPTDAVARSNLVFVCVSDDAAVEQTFDEILKSQSRESLAGKLLIDSTTVSPDTSRRTAAKVRAAGAAFVSAPVFGAAPMADAGVLIIALSGLKPDVERVLPFCTGVMGRAVIDLSAAEGASDADYGRASTLKVLGNSIILRMVESLGETLAVIDKAGLDPKPLQEFIGMLFGGPYSAYLNRMLTADYYNRESPLFGVDLARKDARLNLDIAKQFGAHMPALEVADRYLADVQKEEGSKGDITGMYGASRKHNGLSFGK